MNKFAEDLQELILKSRTGVRIAHFDPMTMGYVFGEGSVEKITMGDLYESVSPSVLAHEISHSFTLTTTPVGLMRYLLEHAHQPLKAEYVAAAARKLEGAVPPGLVLLEALRDDYESDFNNLRDRTTSLYLTRQTMFGDLEIPRNASVLDHIDQVCKPIVTILDKNSPHPPLVLFDSHGAQDSSSPLLLLGELHIYEGIASTVERERWIRSGSTTGSRESRSGREPSPPARPYTIAWSIYERAMREITRCPFPRYEFLAVADTALMMADWLFGQPSAAHSYAATNFITLVGVLQQAGGSLSLLEPSPEARNRFQGDLLNAVEATCQDVREIVSAVKDAAVESIQNDQSFSGRSDAIRQSWIDIFRHNCNHRLDLCHGAEPYSVLIYSEPEHLVRLGHSSSAQGSAGAGQAERRHFDEDSFWLHGFSSEEHIPSVLDQLAFVGRSECTYRSDGCPLDSRPVCFGITSQLSGPSNQCGREFAMQRIMDELDIDEILDEQVAD